MKKIFFSLALLSFFTAALFAQPNYYNTNGGTSTNVYPFGVAGGQRVHWLIRPNELNQPSPCPPGPISALWFYMANSATGTFTNLHIRLGQTTLTSLPPGWYTGTMDTVYFRASVTLSSTTGQWMQIILDHSFNYDPNQSLVVDVGQCSTTGLLYVRQSTHPQGCCTRDYGTYNGGCPNNYIGQDNQQINFGVSLLAPPLAPTLIAPPNGRQGVELTPLLDWTAVQTATSYNAKVSLDTTFVTNVVDTVVVPDSVRIGPLAPETWYYWKVRGLNSQGAGQYSDIWSFRTGPLGISKNGEIPKQYQLYPNYPNPFNPFTLIRFDLPERADLKLIIYNSLGQEIEMLLNGEFQGGSYSVQWDGTNFPSGVYFYKLESNKFTDTKKMLLIK